MGQPVTDLGHYRRTRAIAQQREVYVERRPDPDNPNKNIYIISADTAAAVQSVIDALTAEVEAFGNGYATFVGPRRWAGDQWGAIGKVIVNPEIG